MALKANHTSQSDVQRVHRTRRQTRAFYDGIAPYYDLLSERSERPVRQLALERLAVQPGQRILEIGFGTGHGLEALAAAVGPGGHVDGIDVSRRMLKRARRRLQHQQLIDRVELRRGDAAALPYSDASMDGVLMAFTLELFDTPEIPRVLSECRRVLRRGGRIVAASLTKDAGEPAALCVVEWVHAHVPQVFDCRPIHVRQALADAGFTIISTEVVHAWVPVEVVLGRVPGPDSGGEVLGVGWPMASGVGHPSTPPINQRVTQRWLPAAPPCQGRESRDGFQPNGVDTA